MNLDYTILFPGNKIEMSGHPWGFINRALKNLKFKSTHSGIHFWFIVENENNVRVINFIYKFKSDLLEWRFAKIL